MINKCTMQLIGSLLFFILSWANVVFATEDVADKVYIPKPHGKYFVACASETVVLTSTRKHKFYADNHIDVSIFYPSTKFGENHLLNYQMFSDDEQEVPRQIYTNIGIKSKQIGEENSRFPGVILLPPFGERSCDYTFLAQEISSLGYVVIVPDLSFFEHFVININDDEYYVESDNDSMVFREDVQNIVPSVNKLQSIIIRMLKTQKDIGGLKSFVKFSDIVAIIGIGTSAAAANLNNDHFTMPFVSINDVSGLIFEIEHGARPQALLFHDMKSKNASIYKNYINNMNSGKKILISEVASSINVAPSDRFFALNTVDIRDKKLSFKKKKKTFWTKVKSFVYREDNRENDTDNERTAEDWIVNIYAKEIVDWLKDVQAIDH